LRRSLGGRPLLYHAIEAVTPLVAQVIVVGPAEGPPPPVPPGSASALTLASDEQSGAGPLAGVVAGLRLTNRPLALIVGGDQPTLRRPLLSGLIQAGAAASAAVLADGLAWRPLPCLVRVEPALELASRHLEGPSRRLRDLLEGLDPLIVPEAAWRAWDRDGAWQRDVDSPEDLAAAEAAIRTT
jgi:molybdenum cofactor guanylyltransferase